MSQPPPSIALLLFSFFLCISTPMVLSGCKSEENLTSAEAPTVSCSTCHTIPRDNSHQIECTDCHRGNSKAKTAVTAHDKMLAHPAHPDNFATTCGKCHPTETAELPKALHYTLSNSVNLVRTAFEAKETLNSLTEIPIADTPVNISELADDLLRRRCLRCHLFTPGDTYAATLHGTGCSACHMEYIDGKPVDHRFRPSPADSQCLSCHYGNRVGFDYYGRFEHDLNIEYRTPYSAADTTSRPYGVEYHELAADIHKLHGLACIDCHGRDELMRGGKNVRKKTTCAACHDPALLTKKLPDGVTQEGDGYVLISKLSGKHHKLPLLHHPAHSSNPSVTCQACHAQWSFNDTATHLLRSDLDEYDSWSRLTVQGSSEVEHLLEHNLNFDNDEIPPVMTDKITGDIHQGVWYKGFTMRRWESIPLGRNRDGMVAVMRPMLNLALSWIDENENVVFDGYTATAENHGLTPYTPHTTGPAGLFYEQRLRHFYETEKSPSR